MGQDEARIFRGSFSATVDDKGRLKLPVRLKSQLEAWHGAEVYVTSFTPGEVLIYPLAVYEALERGILALPAMHPVVRKWVQRANYGQEDSVDAQGRLLIPALLRETFALAGEVVVSGRADHLAVLARNRVQAELQSPLSDEDYATLASMGS